MTTNKNDKNVKNDKNKRFIIPTIEEISIYCEERKNQVNPQMFIDHYKSNGWMVGKNKMKDWKATIRTWEQRDYGGQHGKTGSDYKTNWEREQDMEAEAINRE
ncbi:MAG: hypothetical protein Q7J27_00475, partial [Syntrophales bacterium]|nr:hypothetical protein [Syntrophales bacterium]